MMPPQQETAVTSNIPAIPNRPENSSVHAEPPSSATHHDTKPTFITNDNTHNINNSHPSPSPPRFSILRQSMRPITLKFEDVSYTINFGRDKNGCVASQKPKVTRTVLNGVTGMVGPGEVMAMLGPSGSGKTTLLTALAGRLAGKLSGAVTYNGHPFSSSIKRNIGFVSQDDILYPHLTVLETLTYAAMLRLPKSLTKEEKREQVEMIIVELGLSRCRNSPVGGSTALFRGISGGERKRVSIGQEMLVNPSLLLLDEPTSGLDSTTAQRIVAMLQSLARCGRTVVTTIHQPSSRLYRMFDKVVVLSDGYQIFTGPTGRVMDYLESIGFAPAFNFMNPADFLLDLANGIVADVKQDDHIDHHEDQASIKQFLVSSYKKNLYPLLKQEIQQNQRGLVFSTSGTPRSSENQWTTSWWEQFMVLLKRGLKERRHESYSGLRIFQVLTVSILSGLLWWHSDPSHIQDQVGLLFFFSIFWGFFPLFNAIFAFPLDRPMLKKEKSSGMYHLSSYYVARMVGDLPMELVLPTIFVTISYWMGGLKPSLVTFVLTLLIMLFNVLVSQGIGLALGAILMDVKQATTLASVTMLVFLLAGGYYIQQMPSFIAWLKYISFSHYCYKLLVGVQYSVNEVYECGPGLHCRMRDFPAIKCLGLDGLWGDVAVLTVMLIGYRVVAYLALRMGLHH
ncbi:ABC transporter G family member 21 [Cajanus cajan]|uniref:ABC transporter G family member 14 n=1 Tax=Cajanus cajan TaxID=3821 RepID=A0A151S095_CAJCA|nr:ABC transporter G family member 21 [Cajanus cajan]KYP48157.1 ABC transporter G family member 14 [Cajanus cajan]